MAFIYDLTDTWNAGGTTFNAIKMNVTDTASAAASKLVTLQVGGTEKFSVQKDGFTDVNGNVRLSAASPAIELNLGGPQLYVPAANTFALATGGGIGSPVERLRVDASGNVGIGTSSPLGLLEVANETAADNQDTQVFFTTRGTGSGSDVILNLVCENTTTGETFINFGDSAATDAGQLRYNHNGDSMEFRTNSTERMRITGSGNVGIGTSSPNERLRVEGNTILPIGSSYYAYTADYGVGTPDSNGLQIFANPADVIRLGHRSSGSFTERMRIDSSGNVGIGLTTIDSTGYVNLETAKNIRMDMKAVGADPAIYFDHDNFSSNTNNFIALKRTSEDMAFQVAGSERMRITSAGRVGIGTSSPADKLHVDGNIYLGTSNRTIYTGGAGNLVLQNNTGVIQFLRANGASESMRIDSSGNALLGTTTPNGRLSVVGDQISVATGGGSGALGIQIKGTPLTAIPAAQVQGYIATGNSAIGVAGDLLIAPRTSAAANIRFITGTSPAERARIDSSGNLLVGTSSAFDNVSYLKIQSLGGLATKIAGTGATSQVSFFNDNGRVGYIGTSGTTTSYNTSSDYRLKDIDGPLSNSGSYIDALKPVQGSWKADGSRFIGLLAHEVQEVSETQIATGEKDGEEMQAMDYSAPELIANLIAEVQSLRARLAKLETSASTITFEG